MADKFFSDPCIGPIKDHIPEMFWKNISQETQDSYLVGTYESWEKLRMHMPGVNIIVRQFRTDVYQEVLEKLTEAGKLAVEKINPWLMVTMIDLEEFDKVICHMAKSESHPSAESHPSDENNNNQLKTTSPTAGQSQTDVWAKAPTLLLLDEFRKAKDLLDAGKLRKNSLWRKISRKLSETGYTFTEGQVGGRWKTLCRVYKEVKDGGKKSGAGRKDCPYYAELDQILGKDPAVSPKVTLSSATSPSTSARKSSDSDSETEACASSKPKPVKRRKSQASEIVQFLESNVTKQEEKTQQ